MTFTTNTVGTKTMPTGGNNSSDSAVSLDDVSNKNSAFTLNSDNSSADGIDTVTADVSELFTKSIIRNAVTETIISFSDGYMENNAEEIFTDRNAELNATEIIKDENAEADDMKTNEDEKAAEKKAQEADVEDSKEADDTGDLDGDGEELKDSDSDSDSLKQEPKDKKVEKKDYQNNGQGQQPKEEEVVNESDDDDDAIKVSVSISKIQSTAKINANKPTAKTLEIHSGQSIGQTYKSDAPVPTKSKTPRTKLDNTIAGAATQAGTQVSHNQVIEQENGTKVSGAKGAMLGNNAESGM